MRTCVECGGGILRANKDQQRVVVGTTFLVRSPAFVCKSCRSVFLTGDVLARIDVEVASVIALKGSVCGETLRFMRKAVGLRAFELAGLLDVTAETVSRWEHDARNVDLSAWIVLGCIVLEHANRPTATLRRLLATKKPAKMPKTIRLALPEGRAAASSSSAPISSKISRVA